MEIRRKIGEIEIAITLTDTEMWDAYRKEQDIFDCEDVRSRIEDMYDDEDPDDKEVWIGGTETTAGKLRKLLEDDEAIARIAHDMRNCLDNHDGISECLWMACDEAIEDELEED